MRFLLYFLLLFFLLNISILFSSFLYHYDESTSVFNVRCEEDKQILLVSSSGSMTNISLDRFNQASIKVDPQNSYLIVCKNQSAIISANYKAQPPVYFKINENSYFFMFFLIFLALALYFSRIFKLQIPQFIKSVDDKKVTLKIIANGQIENIKIEDPISVSSKKILKLSIPKIKDEWVYSYEYEGKKEEILCAKMECVCENKKFSIISTVVLENRNFKPIKPLKKEFRKIQKEPS